MRSRCLDLLLFRSTEGKQLTRSRSTELKTNLSWECREVTLTVWERLAAVLEAIRWLSVDIEFKRERAIDFQDHSRVLFMAPSEYFSTPKALRFCLDKCMCCLYLWAFMQACMCEHPLPYTHDLNMIFACSPILPTSCCHCLEWGSTPSLHLISGPIRTRPGNASQNWSHCNMLGWDHLHPCPYIGQTVLKMDGWRSPIF